MQVLSPESSFREAIERAAAKLGLHPGPISLTYPPKAELGDLASPVCQEIAGYLDCGLVRKACRRYASHKGYEDGEKLWAAASLGLWLRRARRLEPDV